MSRFQAKYKKIEESINLTRRILESSDEDQQTAKNYELFVAIRKKQEEEEIIEEIKYSLNKGADINAQNTSGKTVLRIAVEKRYKKIIKFLLKQVGIDVNFRHKGDKIAEDPEIIDLLKSHVNYSDNLQLQDVYSNRENVALQVTNMSNQHRKLSSNDFFQGTAVGEGDCFFDSIAQGLKQIFPDQGFTIKSIREDCYNYALEHADDIWCENINNKISLKESILLDNDKVVGDGKKVHGNFVNYLVRAKLTAEEIIKDDKLGFAIWGRPEIEGRIICIKYNVKLHVKETHHPKGEVEISAHQIIDKSGSKSVETMDYNKNNVIHIINEDNLHFVPLLVKTKTHSDNRVKKASQHSDVQQEPFDQQAVQCTQKENRGIKRKKATVKESRLNTDNNNKKRKVEFLDNTETASEGLKLTQHGNIFQLKLLMLFLWRAKESNYAAFRLATELSEAEKFDDVVFQYQQNNDEKWKFRLLQAKHKERVENKLPKIKNANLLSVDDAEAFSLQKYFRSYLKIKQRIKESSIYSVFSESEIEDIIVITNTDFDSGNNNFEEDKTKDIEADELLKVNKDHNTKWQETLVWKIKDQENNEIVRQIKPIFEDTSDFYKLVKELTEHILTEKKIDKTGIFKDYYYPLINEVFKIEKENGKLEFLSKFVDKDGLSKETTEFSNALIKEITFIQNNQNTIKISEEFGKSPLPTDDFQLEKLAKKLAECIEEKQELTVSDFEDYHVALATQVINLDTKTFFSSFYTKKYKQFRKFLKKEIKTIRNGNKITHKQLKLFEFKISQDFGESKLPNRNSKLEKLAETLANAIKDDNELKPSLSEEFKKYHVGLAKEVIDINNKKFQEIFVHGRVEEGNKIKQLSVLSKQFRRLMFDKLITASQLQSTKNSLNEKKIKISKGFKKAFIPETNPTIEKMQEFLQQIKELLSKNIHEKIVEINKNSVAPEKFNTFKANIKNLAGYVLINKFNKVRFSTSFLYSDELPGNLKIFRDKFKNILEKEKFESIYEYSFDITLKGFKTCEEGALSRTLPILHEDADVTDFFEKLKFVVNYPNRIEVNDLLEGEIRKKLKKLDSKAFNSLYQEELHNWMAGKVGTFYTAKKATTLFNEINNNLLLWTIDGFNKPYFAAASKKYVFKEYSNFNDFLLNSNKKVLHLVFKDLALGRTRIVQTFQQLKKEGSANIQKYTRGFGHIFLYLSQLNDISFSSKVYKVLGDKNNFNLIAIECNIHNNIPDLFEQLCTSINNNKKIIFITTDSHHVLAEKFSKGDAIIDDSSVDDIEDNPTKILQEQVITFQERQEISFSELMGISNVDDYLKSNQDSLKQIISTEILIKLINDEKIKIGNNLAISQGYDEDYYISRRFNQQILLNKKKIYKDIKNKQISESDIFVISDTDNRLAVNNNVYVFLENAIELARSKFTELCGQNIGSNIHWLRSNSEKLIWNRSQGSISTLMKYRAIGKVDRTDDNTSKQGLSEHELVNQDHKVVIIADTVGMGKSTVLTDLSLEIKKNNPNLWVIRIDLNYYTAVLDKELANRKSKKQDFSNQDVNTVFNFLLNTLLESREQSKLKTKLEKDLLKSSVNGQVKIALLFDAFDEISPDYKHVVIDILQALKKSKIEKLFVTTRLNLRQILEEKLEIFSYVLEPFSEQNQIDFFTKFWTKKLELTDLNEKHKARLKIYAEFLISIFSKSINDREQEFIGIPLQTRMLAEVFQENIEEALEGWQGCKEFLTLNNMEPKLPAKFDLLGLYDHFVKRKFYDLYLTEKKGRDLSKIGENDLADENYESFKKRHETLALSGLFNDEDLKKILSKEELLKQDSWMNEIERAKKNEGIIDQIVDNKAHFIHRIFAEYFTANLIYRWFIQNDTSKEKKSFSIKILIEPDFKVVQKFFDQKLKSNPIPNDIWKKTISSLVEEAYEYDIIVEKIINLLYDVDYCDCLLETFYESQKLDNIEDEKDMEIIIDKIQDKYRLPLRVTWWEKCLTDVDIHTDMAYIIEQHLDILTRAALQRPLKDILNDIPSDYPSSNDSDGNSLSSQQAHTDLFMYGHEYENTTMRNYLRATYIDTDSETENLERLANSGSD